jgi:hypothetical protein
VLYVRLNTSKLFVHIMSKIIIDLPEDRNRAGVLRLVNDRGADAAGHFPCHGKADSKTAMARGNPDRDRIKLYGDTPYGSFDIIDIVKTGENSIYNAKNYGAHGAIRLRPREGEAALAAQTGRTGLLIHAGDPAPQGGLRPTNGCIRLSNDDMKALLEAIAILAINEHPPATCIIQPSAKSFMAKVGPDEEYDENDPPSGMSDNWHLLSLLDAHLQMPQSHLLKSVSEVPEPVAQGHDREAHDREVHDREAHDREANNREPASHDRDANHDRDAHDRDAAHGTKGLRQESLGRELEGRGHDRDSRGHDRDV